MLKEFGMALVVLAFLVVSAGLGVTVLELRKLNASLETLKNDGVWVHGASQGTSLRKLSAFRGVNVTGGVSVIGDVDARVVNTVDIEGTVAVEGTVDVDARVLNTVDVEGMVAVRGTVDVEGQVEITSCNTRYVGCDPIEVRVVR